MSESLSIFIIDNLIFGDNSFVVRVLLCV